MDGKGGWRDKVFVERLWRAIKYAEPGYETLSPRRLVLPGIRAATTAAGRTKVLTGKAPPAAVMTSMRCDWHKGAYCTLGGGS